MGVRGQHHAPATLPPGKDTITIVQEAGWDPGPAWAGAENLATTGIRFPDRPARSVIAIPTELSRPPVKGIVFQYYNRLYIPLRYGV